MKQLTINRARALGKDMNAKGVVILAFGDDGEFQAASYGRTKQDCGQLGKWLDRIYDAVESGEMAAPFVEQQSPERLTRDSARPAVSESRLIEAAAAARSLLSKLSARLEIDEELHAEISRVEETLWGVLFPGAQPPKRKWSFNDEGFECHVDLGDVHNELKRRPRSK